MNNLSLNVTAIQKFNTREGIFLRVMGEGTNQYLKAEKISWFGRILMWFGCSTASMRKVACFLYKHIHTLSHEGSFDLNDPKNSLGNLVQRVQKYDQSHPSRIQYYACTITSAYNDARIAQKRISTISTPLTSQPANTPVSQPATTPLVSNPSTHVAGMSTAQVVISVSSPVAAKPKTPTSIQKIAQTASTGTSPAANYSIIITTPQSPIPASKLAPLIPATPQAAATAQTFTTPQTPFTAHLTASLAHPVTPFTFPASPMPQTPAPPPSPATPRSPAVQQCLDIYKAQRSYVVKAGAYLSRDKNISKVLQPFTQTDSTNAVAAMKAIQKLFVDYSKDPHTLEALINEMSLTDIEYFCDFALCTPYSTEEKAHKDIYIDIFNIMRWSPNTGPSQLLTAILKYMTDAQLKIVISKVGKAIKNAAFFSLGEYFYSLPNAQKDVYFDEISRYSLFVNAFQNTSSATRNKIFKELAYRRLINLLDAPQKSEREIISHLDNLWSNFKDSPLEDRAYFDRLSDTHRAELLGYYSKSECTPDQFFDSLLVSDVIATSNTMLVFNALSQKPDDKLHIFISKFLDRHPSSDQVLFNYYIEKAQDRHLCLYITKILTVSSVPHKNSAIVDQAYIDGLSEKSLLFLGRAIVNAIKMKHWDLYQAVLDRILKNPTLAIQLFKDSNSIPYYKNCKIYQIPHYCRKEDSLNAIVDSMTAAQKVEWEAYKPA